MPGILNSFSFGSGLPLSMFMNPGDVDVYRSLPYGQAQTPENYEVSGGSPPYTYETTQLSGDPEIMISSGATAAVILIAEGNGEPINTKEGVFRFKVTDAALNEIIQDCTVRFIFGLDPP